MIKSDIRNLYSVYIGILRITRYLTTSDPASWVLFLILKPRLVQDNYHKLIMLSLSTTNCPLFITDTIMKVYFVIVVAFCPVRGFYWLSAVNVHNSARERKRDPQKKKKK